MKLQQRLPRLTPPFAPSLLASLLLLLFVFRVPGPPLSLPHSRSLSLPPSLPSSSSGPGVSWASGAG